MRFGLERIGSDACRRAEQLHRIAQVINLEVSVGMTCEARSFYGARLKQKHASHLASVDELRTLVRRLLRSLLHLAAVESAKYKREFFESDLDTDLLDAGERDALRRALRLA